MTQKHIYSAYRTPRISWKAIGLSLITLGLKKPKGVQEEGKIYKLILENQTLDIYEEPSTGKSRWLETVQLEGKEKTLIHEKNKYYTEQFVYYMDRY